MTAPRLQPNKLSTHIAKGSPIILDGALATYLETLGTDISGALWSADILLKNASLIQKTHLDYYRAGANVAITASYQASVPGLAKHLGLNEHDAKAIVGKSVELARQAQDEMGEDIRQDLLVAGSVGPYGAFLADGSEYRGDYDVPREEMKDFHRGRIQALVDAGVDALACETMPSKAEVQALLELITDEFPDTEAWFSFTLRDTEHISDGTSLKEIAALFDDVQQVVALGFNCVPDDLALAALRTLKPLIKRGTLVVYPNSGEQWNAQAREWEGKRTEGSTLAEKTLQWWSAGAGMIGGCCRTTPEDIVVMKKALEKVR
ncbi:Homocysteine S-methyltransferase [Decorospora gaudefroyi]|uniref:Homocysteine S-methyltransferase n=1 Tax=Decorospora gaudefroyi TaxID=184978 RepID=A0A6A5KWF4_9PLEO|nr:Homocysteine S-methyltransferase [Decorospora gaudefroyi]